MITARLLVVSYKCEINNYIVKIQAVPTAAVALRRFRQSQPLSVAIQFGLNNNEWCKTCEISWKDNRQEGRLVDRIHLDTRHAYYKTWIKLDRKNIPQQQQQLQ